jgi:hypothetical protein
MFSYHTNQAVPHRRSYLAAALIMLVQFLLSLFGYALLIAGVMLTIPPMFNPAYRDQPGIVNSPAAGILAHICSGGLLMAFALIETRVTTDPALQQKLVYGAMGATAINAILLATYL